MNLEGRSNRRTCMKVGDLMNAVQDLETHSHLCLLYETKEEQYRAVLPFIRAGLRKGEKCVYIRDESSEEDILKGLYLVGVDVKEALESGSLTMLGARDAYLRSGFFQPEAMIDFLAAAADAALRDGYSALRVTGEMTWVLGDAPGGERLSEYEARLNDFFERNEVLAICQYNASRFGADVLFDVVQVHPLVVCGDMLCRNFYYVPPGEFLEEDAASALERVLGSIAEREREGAKLREIIGSLGEKMGGLRGRA
jgi:hypothetical protein